MIYKKLIFLTLFGVTTYLRADKPNNDVFMKEVEAESYLIYDCEERHWACVPESDFKTCEEQRARDELRDTYLHTCAPIGEFPTKKSCYQRQLFLTTHNHGNRFCVKDYWKSKILEF